MHQRTVHLPGPGVRNIVLRRGRVVRIGEPLLHGVRSGVPLLIAQMINFGWEAACAALT